MRCRAFQGESQSQLSGYRNVVDAELLACLDLDRSRYGRDSCVEEEEVKEGEWCGLETWFWEVVVDLGLDLFVRGG